jgi:hypothetical protein
MSSLALILANALIAAGLVLQPPMTGIRAQHHAFSAQLPAGILCLVLALLNILVALGPARYGLFAGAAQVVSPVAFWISGTCYALCGIVLLRPPRAGSRRHVR